MTFGGYTKFDDFLRNPCQVNQNTFDCVAIIIFYSFFIQLPELFRVNIDD